MYIPDAVTQWNAWTNNNKLNYAGNAPPPPGGIQGCGNGDRCIVYGNDYEYITVNGKTCLLPELSPSWGRAYFGDSDDTTWWIPNCPLYGPDQYPNWVVSYNNEVPAAQTHPARIHIARHEMGHALGLGHHSGSCWSMHGFLYPLMNGGTSCAGFPDNYRATGNEQDKVESLNNW